MIHVDGTFCPMWLLTSVTQSFRSKKFNFVVKRKNARWVMEKLWICSHLFLWSSEMSDRRILKEIIFYTLLFSRIFQITFYFEKIFASERIFIHLQQLQNSLSLNLSWCLLCSLRGSSKTPGQNIPTANMTLCKTISLILYVTFLMKS